MRAPYFPLPACLIASACFWLGLSAASARTPKRAAAEPAEAASASGGGIHVVTSKDTLYGLAKQYGTSVEKIKAANGLRSNTLRDGARLRIPGAGAGADTEAPADPESEAEPAPAAATEPGPAARPAVSTASEHIVQKGDTLFGISKKYGVTVSALKKANGLRGDSISRGQRLRLPGGQEPAEEGTMSKIGQAIKGIAGDLTGSNEEQTTETREVITTEASIKKNGPGKTTQKEVDDNLATYLVTPYDSLEKIAVDFNTTSARLMELNKLASAGDLRTKKQILVPGNGLNAKWSKAY